MSHPGSRSSQSGNNEAEGQDGIPSTPPSAPPVTLPPTPPATPPATRFLDGNPGGFPNVDPIYVLSGSLLSSLLSNTPLSTLQGTRPPDDTPGTFPGEPGNCNSPKEEPPRKPSSDTSEMRNAPNDSSDVEMRDVSSSSRHSSSGNTGLGSPMKIDTPPASPGTQIVILLKRLKIADVTDEDMAQLVEHLDGFHISRAARAARMLKESDEQDEADETVKTDEFQRARANDIESILFSIRQMVAMGIPATAEELNEILRLLNELQVQNTTGL
ncbi:hypothetical protein GGS26DRAFT_555893, partial [Hypomontagnella submonticulosa]